MAKRKNLNGIPHNITQSFFGTERYYDGGYMGDWLLYAARHLNLTKASLDILNTSFTPTQLNLRPLILTAKSLKEIIVKELHNNGFEEDFIKEAHIDFQFPDANLYRSTIYCFPYLIDKEEKRYECGRLVEGAYEPEFNPFDKLQIAASMKSKSIIEQIKGLFK